MHLASRRATTVRLLVVALVAAFLGTATVTTPAGAIDCAVPAGATHVATWGSDASGNGSAENPYRTIQAAVDRTGAGATIVVRGGDYRESVVVRGSGRHLVAAPGETVWISGSDAITSWTTDGPGRWRSTGTPAAGLDQTSSFTNALMIDDRPIAGHLAAVFVDGNELTQVSSAAAVDAGHFHVDGAGRVTIGTDPNGRFVEVSTRSTAVVFDNASDSSMTGFTVRRFATSYAERGAIRVDAESHRVTLSDLRVVDNSNVGAQVLGDDAVVRFSTFERNGRMGLNAHQADRLLIDHSRFVENNDEGFANTAAAAGVKVTSSRDIRIQNSRFERNHSDGVWIDMSSLRADVLANAFVHNDEISIHLEVSADLLVASNTSVGGRRGIQVGESNDVQIWNNVILDAGPAIAVLEGSRDAATGQANNGFALPYDSRYGHVPDVTWNISDVIVRNNVMARGNLDSAMFFVQDPSETVSAEDMNVNADHNLFHRSSTASPRWVVGWGDWPIGMAAIETVGAWAARPGDNGTGSLETTGSLTAVNDDAGDLRVRTGGPADGAGTTLPGWIEARLGTTSNDIGLAVTPPTDVGPRSCASSHADNSGSGNGTGGGGASGVPVPSDPPTPAAPAEGPAATPGSATFSDVAAGSYYDQAVGWLVATGATTGTAPALFDPNGLATRAQLATLLWRLAGEPAATPGSATFSDVAAGSYYDQAVGWLVATGATTGTSPTTFSPDNVGTRAQLATLLWRLNGEPISASGSAIFADVSRGSYYDVAVGWMAATGATTGTTPTTYAPDDVANRAQVATVLWRLEGT